MASVINSNISQFDVVIIGSGAAGLKAGIEVRKNSQKKVAIISKVIPTNSHTVAAKGGINASLGNQGFDDWRWHAFDTIKGSDFLADEKAVEILCKNANKAVLDLEKIGVVFSRDESGKISQRAYGGQTLNYGKGGVAKRACYSKDKIGQTILYSLYAEALKLNIEFFSEFFVFDLLFDENLENKNCQGCVAFNIENGEIQAFQANSTIIATGGYSQIYKNTTSSSICTGDGTSLVAQNFLPLQDMEFIQFHPTGIAGVGFLISEAARSEGAYLLNQKGERFMKNYAPKMMELSSRDIISRAIAIEIKEGRGCGKNKNSIHLDLRHLSEETLIEKIPGVVEIAKNFAKVDVKKDLIEIFPTAHYTMGGIPTDLNCQVVDFEENKVAGLFAIGETACVSVHGANRLGCNSLLDLLVFGEIAGKNIASLKDNYQNSHNFKKIIDKKIADFQNLLQKNHQNQNLENIKSDLQNINEKYLGVFRSESLLNQGFEKINNLFSEFQNYGLKNKSLFFNDELILYFEVKNLFLNSIISFFCAIQRKESRGAHFREDFCEKDDLNWRFHSFAKIQNGAIEFKKRDVQ